MTPIAAIQASLDDRRLPEGRWLLACSGGLDSMALLQAILAAGCHARLVVATVDHGIHGQSAEQCRFVLQTCERLSVDAHILKLDGRKLKEADNLEAAARQARYQALDELRNELGLSAVLTAHTADDQAETLLMRLAKGSGLRGLRGILPVWSSRQTMAGRRTSICAELGPQYWNGLV